MIRKISGWKGGLFAAAYMAVLAGFLWTNAPSPPIFSWTPRELALAALFACLIGLFALMAWNSLRRARFWTRWLVNSCLIGTALTLSAAGAGSRWTPDMVGVAVVIYLAVGLAAAALEPLTWWAMPDLTKD
ncbi:hypothetical protein [Caulobacter sp. 17J65-9]|uniref:hypothetical protein n=1 Tax=Caulobacter sp. 17J65-9 TaxID=2709382 RepID=UPI0013C67745|nr:hypothetical protein [Caulobacter sp. 17J65-9]NEX93813.1 hypothetical protein [Caulobacter sp. 17J65-9]